MKIDDNLGLSELEKSLVTAFPSSNKETSENLAYRTATPCILVSSGAGHELSKSGEIFKVSDTSFNISKMNLSDLLLKLSTLGVDAKLMDSSDVSLKYLPAILLCNFSSTYSGLLEPTINPIDIKSLTMVTDNAITCSSRTVSDILVMDEKSSILNHEVSGDNLFYTNAKGVVINYKLKCSDQYAINIFIDKFSVTTKNSVYRFDTINRGIN